MQLQADSQSNPYRGLVAAIILRALKDVAEHYNPPDAMRFLRSTYCKDLAYDFLDLALDDGCIRKAVTDLREDFIRRNN